MGSLHLLAVAIVVFVFHFTSATSSFEVGDDEWENFKKFYGKSYVTVEENRFRKFIYQGNVRLIAEHNARNLSYTLGMNQFGDWTSEEYARLLGLRGQKMVRNGSSFLAPNNVAVPDNIDWRDHGYVTHVKNQGQCGSCWAFSTTGSLEGQHFRKTGRLVSLSEQNLVDCSKNNDGCGGGLMDNAFEYIKTNNGIDTEQSYPYVGRDGSCHYTVANRGAEDTGYVDIKADSEGDLKLAVGTVGPVSVAIDASHQSFMLYKSGVYDEPACSQTLLDHGVLAVGYGTTENGQDYWLVKNSWGESWGMNGYVRMSRNKDNQCGIASKASYPLV